MKSAGYIKLHRKIQECEFYFSEPFTRVQAWIDLLLIANHNTTEVFVRGNRIVVERGQTAMSLKTLAKRWSWSIGKVTRFLEYLENKKMIDTQKSNVISLISILNYQTYQGNEYADRYADRYADEYADGTQTDTQTETNNNDKNEKNDNNINIHTHFTREDGSSKTFGVFENVFLTDAGVERIKMQLSYRGLDPEKYFTRVVDKISAYKKQNGRHFSDDAAACINFGIAAVIEEDQRTAPRGTQQKSKFEKIDDALEEYKRKLEMEEE